MNRGNYKKRQLAFRDYIRRFHYDTLTYYPETLRFLINLVGADRVVIGSDHPFDMAPADLMAGLDAIPDLSASEREYVCSLTALSLLDED